MRGQRTASQRAPEPGAQAAAGLTIRRTPHRQGRGYCPCFTCRRTKAAGTKRWKERVARGEEIWGDADAVTAHIRKLSAMGMSAVTIANLAGVGHMSTRLNRRSRRVTSEVARRILAVRFDVRACPPLASVDSTGVRRRLQGLIVAGWNVPALAKAAGVERQEFRNYLFEPRAAAKTCVRLLDLFEHLLRQRPPELTPFAAARRLTAIERNGWVGLGAWDEETIDDPDAVPVLDGEEAVDEVLIQKVLDGWAKFKILNEPERIELVRRWDASGASISMLEKRLRVSSTTSRKFYALAGLSVADTDDQKESA